MSGKLFIISGPSGVGKSTLISAILKSMKGIERVVSYTTRPKREQETEGIDYFFIDKETYQSMYKRNKFLTYIEINHYHYGATAKSIYKKLEQNIDLLIDIDHTFLKRIKEKVPNNTSIFILPPCPIFPTLENRLQMRKERPEIIAERLSRVEEIMLSKDNYDYTITNETGKLDVTIQGLQDIINNNRSVSLKKELTGNVTEKQVQSIKFTSVYQEGNLYQPLNFKGIVKRDSEDNNEIEIFMNKSILRNAMKN